MELFFNPAMQRANHDDELVTGQRPIPVMPMSQQTNLRSTEDDWTGITSTARRKRAQNRIHQREYRRKRKLQKGAFATAYDSISSEIDTKGDGATATAPSAEDWPSTRSAHGSMEAHLGTPRNMCQLSKSETWDRLGQLAMHAHAANRAGTPILQHLPLVAGINVLNALAENASILGVSQLWLDYDAVSPFSQQLAPVPPSIVRERLSAWCPDNLRPTRLQAEISHHPWLDLFPLPRMRDNIIEAISTDNPIDEDDLCYDLVDVSTNGESGKASLIVWGSQPWDTHNWEVTVPFIKKWGGLLNGCEELIRATNYWRERRGERPIRL